MAPAVEWTNVHLAGAFLVGVVFGTVVTLRVLRIAVGLLRRQRGGDRPY